MTDYQFAKIILLAALLLCVTLVGSCQGENYNARQMADKGFCLQPILGNNVAQWQKCQ